MPVGALAANRTCDLSTKARKLVAKALGVPATRRIFFFVCYGNELFKRGLIKQISIFGNKRFFEKSCQGSLAYDGDKSKRVMVIEVMGRQAGWIALYGGVAGG